jgi:predicted N-formylglutamate amidohydrolase
MSMDEEPYRLLEADEAAPVTVYNEHGRSPFLIVVDHASNLMPRSLNRLGLTEHECARHIAADIGVASVSRVLANALDATLVQQNYSRLVIDCNRPVGSEASITEISEGTPIPGNVALSAERQAARATEIFRPYHDRITAELDRRQEEGKQLALIAMHSFTPSFMGHTRPWHVGVLYNRDRRFAEILLALMKRQEGLIVGDNEPYSVSDLTDYTIPVHGEGRGLIHAEIEIRQDLIDDASGQQDWGARFANWLLQAFQGLESFEPH